MGRRQKRRDNGEGSIYQDPQGQWWAIAPPDPVTGKRARRRAKDRADARAKLKAMLEARRTGLDITRKDLTLQAFVALWLEEDVKTSRRPKTYEQYEMVMRRYFAPLQHLKLQQLTYAVLITHQNMLLTRHAAGTVKIARRVLHICLEAAVTWGYLAENPAAKLPVPKQGQPSQQASGTWTADQAKRFLAFVLNHRLRGLWHVALYLGLRRGELLGLRWIDIDFEKRTLTIRQTIEQGNNGARIGEPKTEESIRTLPLSPALLMVLRVHRVIQDEERKVFTEWVDHGLVFASTIGTPMQPSNLWRMFKERIAAYNVDATPELHLPVIRFHDLRHTCATILLEEGVDLKLISAVLGHSSISITADIYAHATERSVRSVGDVMDRAMGEEDDTRETGT